MSNRLTPGVRALALLSLAASALAAPKIDLTRIEPVPANQPIPIVDFFRQPVLSEPKINRAGTHVAALGSSPQDRGVLVVIELASKKSEVAAPSGERDIYDAHWLGNDRVLFNLSSEKLKGMAMCVAQVGRISRSYPVLQYGGPQLVRIPEEKPLQPLVWMRRDFETGKDEGVHGINTLIELGPVYDLFASNRSGNEQNEIRHANNQHMVESYPIPKDGITTEYLCDKDDKLAFAINSRDGVLSLYRLEGKSWIKCPVNLDDIDVLGTGPNPGEILVLGPRQDGKPRALQLMNALTGEPGTVLLQDDDYDIHGRIYREFGTQRILGVRYHRNTPRMVWFDAKFLEVQKALDGLFPGQVVEILDWNKDVTKFVVGRYTDRQPVIYDWVDLQAGSAGPIRQSRPWIDPTRMAATNMLKFKTADGRQLDAYLTLPAGTSREKPAPMVVLPHDGPYQRDTLGFNAQVQFYASRGYAVLQPNYRGSPGRNWAFPREDEWDYVKMRDDVFSATRTALATKLLDRSRVAIVGTSFGGYLALAGAVHQPTLYRCAVAINGVFDWGKWYDQSKYNQHDSAHFGWMKRRIGDADVRKDWYEAISPMRQAGQVKVPMFIAHGKEDSVQEMEQARELLSRLDKGLGHEQMTVGGDGHGMGYVDNQVEMYARIEAFLAKHLAAGAAAR